MNVQECIEVLRQHGFSVVSNPEYFGHIITHPLHTPMTVKIDDVELHEIASHFDIAMMQLNPQQFEDFLDKIEMPRDDDY